MSTLPYYTKMTGKSGFLYLIYLVATHMAMIGQTHYLLRKTRWKCGCGMLNISD